MLERIKIIFTKYVFIFGQLLGYFPKATKTRTACDRGQQAQILEAAERRSMVDNGSNGLTVFIVYISLLFQ